MRRITALASALAFTLLPAAGLSQHKGWHDDFDKAVKEARRKKKDLFVLFTGSDWCGWCIRLDEEVFQDKAFTKSMRRRYVLVALDFPKGAAAKKKVPNPERNELVGGRYKLRGYPTVLLMTADGDVYGRTGYQEGGAKSYLAHLQKFADTDRPQLEYVDVLRKRVARARGEELEEVVREVCETLRAAGRDKPGRFGLAELAKRAFEIDPDNEKHLQELAVDALLETYTADAAAIELIRAADPENQKGWQERIAKSYCREVSFNSEARRLIDETERVAELGFRDPVVEGSCYTHAAIWADEMLGDSEMAKRFAKKALGMKLRHVPETKQILERIAGQ